MPLYLGCEVLDLLFGLSRVALEQLVRLVGSSLVLRVVLQLSVLLLRQVLEVAHLLLQFFDLGLGDLELTLGLLLLDQDLLLVELGELAGDLGDEKPYLERFGGLLAEVLVPHV